MEEKQFSKPSKAKSKQREMVDPKKCAAQNSSFAVLNRNLINIAAYICLLEE